mgnify:CR=1 FL=1
MLAGFAPPTALHGLPEEAEASDSTDDSDSGADSDENKGPAAAVMMGSGMAVRAGRCPTVTGMDGTSSAAAMAPPATKATKAATGPPAATAATAPPVAKAATAFAVEEAPAFAAAESIMTMALAEIADDTIDSATAEETEQAATARVEAATARVLAATVNAEAMAPTTGAPVDPAGIVHQTERIGTGGSQRLRPCLLSHAPFEFAAEFRAMSEDPRFSSALNDDCDDDHPDLEFFCDVASMMMRGGVAGWIGEAS